MKAILQLFLAFFQSKKEAPDYITEIEQTIKKLQCLQSGKVFIITDNRKQELMTFLKKFSFATYADAQIKRPFELYQGTHFLYEGVMNISRNYFNIDGMSRGDLAHGRLFYTFCSKLEEIIANRYETYLKENNLTELDTELSKNIDIIWTHLNNLRISNAEGLLNDMKKQIDLRTQNLPFFFKFQEKIENLEKERRRI